MPKMLMFAIAGASALVGAAMVQFTHRRTAFAGMAQTASARVRAVLARGGDAVARARNRQRGRPSSENSCFDAYQATALRSLEEEHKQFEGFLERLRDAEDRDAFRAFLASRRAAVAQRENPPTDTSKGE